MYYTYSLVLLYIFTHLCILSRPTDSTKYIRLVKKYPAVLNDYLCNNLYIYIYNEEIITPNLLISQSDHVFKPSEIMSLMIKM